jgi:plasmid stability protein
MPDFLIEDLDPGLVQRLQRRAELNGRSLEEEVRIIIETALESDLLEETSRKPSPRARRAGFS